MTLASIGLIIGGAIITWFAKWRIRKLQETHMDEMEHMPIEPPQTIILPPEPIKVVEPVKVPVTPKKPMKTNILDLFATAQRDFEGKPGDRNYKNNNPGNYRFSPVGYLSKYGNVTKVAGFACFPTYALGWEYHLASIMHTAHLHPNWTIRQYVDNYAPVEDNNLNNARYANALAEACGVPVTTTLGELFS